MQDYTGQPMQSQSTPGGQYVQVEFDSNEQPVQNGFTHGPLCSRCCNLCRDALLRRQYTQGQVVAPQGWNMYCQLPPTGQIPQCPSCVDGHSLPCQYILGMQASPEVASQGVQIPPNLFDPGVQIPNPGVQIPPYQYASQIQPPANLVSQSIQTPPTQFYTQGQFPQVQLIPRGHICPSSIPQGQFIAEGQMPQNQLTSEMQSPPGVFSTSVQTPPIQFYLQGQISQSHLPQCQCQCAPGGTMLQDQIVSGNHNPPGILSQRDQTPPMQCSSRGQAPQSQSNSGGLFLQDQNVLGGQIHPGQFTSQVQSPPGIFSQNGQTPPSQFLGGQVPQGYFGSGGQIPQNQFIPVEQIPQENNAFDGQTPWGLNPQGGFFPKEKIQISQREISPGHIIPLGQIPQGQFSLGEQFLIQSVPGLMFHEDQSLPEQHVLAPAGQFALGGRTPLMQSAPQSLMQPSSRIVDGQTPSIQHTAKELPRIQFNSIHSNRKEQDTQTGTSLDTLIQENFDQRGPTNQNWNKIISDQLTPHKRSLHLQEEPHISPRGQSTPPAGERSAPRQQIIFSSGPTAPTETNTERQMLGQSALEIQSRRTSDAKNNISSNQYTSTAFSRGQIHTEGPNRDEHGTQTGTSLDQRVLKDITNQGAPRDPSESSRKKSVHLQEETSTKVQGQTPHPSGQIAPQGKISSMRSDSERQIPQLPSLVNKREQGTQTGTMFGELILTDSDKVDQSVLKDQNSTKTAPIQLLPLSQQSISERPPKPSMAEDHIPCNQNTPTALSDDKLGPEVSNRNEQDTQMGTSLDHSILGLLSPCCSQGNIYTNKIRPGGSIRSTCTCAEVTCNCSTLNDSNRSKCTCSCRPGIITPKHSRDVCIQCAPFNRCISEIMPPCQLRTECSDRKDQHAQMQTLPDKVVLKCVDREDALEDKTRHEVILRPCDPKEKLITVISPRSSCYCIDKTCSCAILNCSDKCKNAYNRYRGIQSTKQRKKICKKYSNACVQCPQTRCLQNQNVNTSVFRFHHPNTAPAPAKEMSKICENLNDIPNSNADCECHYPPNFRQFQCTGNACGICKCLEKPHK